MNFNIEVTGTYLLALIMLVALVVITRGDAPLFVQGLSYVALLGGAGKISKDIKDKKNGKLK